jgi:hypothetical protein
MRAAIRLTPAILLAFVVATPRMSRPAYREPPPPVPAALASDYVPDLPITGTFISSWGALPVLIERRRNRGEAWSQPTGESRGVSLQGGLHHCPAACHDLLPNLVPAWFQSDQGSPPI